MLMRIFCMTLRARPHSHIIIPMSVICSLAPASAPTSSSGSLGLNLSWSILLVIRYVILRGTFAGLPLLGRSRRLPGSPASKRFSQLYTRLLVRMRYYLE